MAKENTEYSELVDYLMKVEVSTKPKAIWNHSCLKCETVEKVMVKIGALCFCTKCYKEEFHTENPLKEERENYKKWLKVYGSKYI